MFPNPTPTTLILLFFGVSTFILIMLLPALLELTKPRDSGPRIIMDDTITQQFQTKGIPLANIEVERFGLDKKIVVKIRDIIAILPNLET